MAPARGFLHSSGATVAPQAVYDAHAKGEHTEECNPTNCDISGEDWLVRLFVKRVNETISRGEICTMYEVPSDFAIPGITETMKIWPQMKVKSFRDKVLAELPDGRFLPPDELDEWVFVIYPKGMRR